MKNSTLILLFVIVFLVGMVLSFFLVYKKETFPILGQFKVDGPGTAGLTNGQSMVRGQHILDVSVGFGRVDGKLEITKNGDLVHTTTKSYVFYKKRVSKILMRNVEKVEVSEEGPEVFITKSDGSKIKWKDMRSKGNGTYWLLGNTDFYRIK